METITTTSSFLTATTAILVIFLVLGISTMTGASAVACTTNYEKGPQGTCIGDPIGFTCPANYIENPENPNECIYDADPNTLPEDIDYIVGKVGICSAGTYEPPDSDADSGKCIAPRGERLN
jgi:hypothetical protein